MASNHSTGFAVVVSAVLIAAIVSVPVAAHPLNSSDHGVSEETFHKLWSADRDGASPGWDLTGTSAIKQLAKRTDIPFDSPPQAVGKWNRGDHSEFPATDSSVSIYPPHATLTNGRYIREAYTEIFAVQPSTRARLSASQPLYVAPEGELLGTVDFRVAVPSDDTSGDRRVYWSLLGHQIEVAKVLIDGGEETIADGSHTPALPYSLQEHGGGELQLTLAATISVRLRKEVEVCLTENETGDCSHWESSVSYPTENISVSDSIRVVKYDLAVSGFIGEYPNGDLGLVVFKNKPWLGYRLPNGDVRGVWRFYSSRDKDWDTLVYSSADAKRTAHSPLHPLQVNAYPIARGVTPSSRRNITILDVYGTSSPPPTLPSNVYLDVTTEPYTASYGIATRAATDDQPEFIRAWGLVRGVEAARPADDFARIRIYESNLSLAVVNQAGDTVTLRVSLQNANTGDPINTTARDGYVVLNGQRLNTTGSGTLTTTIDAPAGGVSARYEPGHWWHNTPGYTGDSDTVLLGGSRLQVESMLSGIGVSFVLFSLAVFFVDRITGWRLWPPWRSL